MSLQLPDILLDTLAQESVDHPLAACQFDPLQTLDQILNNQYFVLHILNLMNFG